jgi:arylsulfatase A
LTVREFAFNEHFKLYRDGRLFDLAADLDEQKPLSGASLTADARAAAASLQKALDQFTEARPAELDRAFEQSEPQPAKVKKDKKAKKRQ